MKEPKLRFPEFAGDWVQRILSDVIVDIADGPFGSNLKLEHYTNKKEARIIQLSNLSDYGWQEENTRYTTFEHAEAIKRCIVNEGELIMGKMMPAGMTIMRPTTDKMYVLSSDCVRIKLDKSTVTDEFFLYTTKSEEFLNQIRSSSQGSTRIRTSISKIKNMNLNIPSLPEQQKIGFLFTKLDALIQSAEKELEGYRELKQGMLQKIFPKKGETVPEIRFPEFDGSWELCKISELCSVATGKSNTQDKVEDGKYPFYVRSPIVERSTKYLYDEEAVITVGDGVGTGKVFHYVNGKYDLHQRCYRMYGFSDKLNAHYFYYVFSKLFYKRVKSMTAKTSVDSVRMEMIADMKIPVPTIEEQIKIGTYFDNLDNLIALQQKEIDGYKELKKGLLQQMFC